MLLREVEFISTLPRRYRGGSDKEEKSLGVFDSLSEFFALLLTRRYALVVSDIHALLVKPSDLWIDDILILMRIAHEHIGIVSFVG